ncbi:hypothetical protein BO94DRAFT_146644 [Aspergillus sclerotioniger CBS 115572]|uniref:Cytochrome c domain-containing protein n=1 Tax=Aspergillus sclerotioniger CBS 115572 TaxID=1450535 RepID=A0A317W5K3_9EURO|nr:hypothetical protein BO94DRAFT_146644 [Aspergillus sclerotioniger CBS 115572]PWY81623.1 hypothetical protein BO94DRAFT_146644 [Aspergillus sclerotioniger CBS 115572]
MWISPLSFLLGILDPLAQILQFPTSFLGRPLLFPIITYGESAEQLNQDTQPVLLPNICNNNGNQTSDLTGIRPWLTSKEGNYVRGLRPSFETLRCSSCHGSTRTRGL